MRSILRPTAVTVLLTALASACSDDGLQKLSAHLLAPEVVDFGRTQVGTTADRIVQVENDGGLVLQVRVAIAESPFSAQVSTFSVRPGESFPVPVRFSPTASSAEPLSAVLSLHVGDTVQASVVLKGQPVLDGITVAPNPVDFGTVLVGDHRDVSIVISNNEVDEVAIHVERDQFGNPRVSSTRGDGRFEIISITGAAGPTVDERIALAPNQTLVVVARYTPSPTAVGRAPETARWELSLCDNGACPMFVQMRGVSTDAALECSGIVDFGSVHPGSTATRPVQCVNIGQENVEITSLSMSVGSDREFAIRAGALPIRVGGQAEVSMDVHFAPTMENWSAMETLAAEMVIASATGAPRRALASVRVRLMGRAGGPQAVVAPRSLNFGRRALGTQGVKRILVTNSGLERLTIEGLRFASGAFTSTQAITQVESGASALLSVTFRPSDVGVVESTAVVVTNDGSQPEIVVQLSGEGVQLPPCEYTVSPSSLNFGVVVVPRSNLRTVEVTNIGASACLVSDFQVTGDYFSLVDQPTAEVLLQAGATLSFGVRYSPQAEARNNGKAEFYISDPNAPMQTIPLFGVATAAGLVINPEHIDFGVVGVDCAGRDRTLTVYNGSATAALIERIEVVDTTTASAFTVVGLPGSIPAPPGHVLAPGGTFTFSAAFRPSGGTTHHGEIQLFEQGRADPYIVGLAGRVAEQPRSEDRFQQTGSPEIDILFMIDNSCSMGVFQAELAANFSSFIQQAVLQGYDYQMAVITADAGDESGYGCQQSPGMRPAGLAQGKCGYFADGDGMGTRQDPSWRIITPRTLPSPVEAFQAVALQGSGGEGIERGLETAYEALTPPKATAWNAGFVRPNAGLAIVIVSDDDDDSSEIGSPRPDWQNLYLNHFRSIKGFANPEKFSLSAIISPPVPSLGLPMCSTEGPGFIYTHYAQMTGGFVASICPGVDWAQTLSTVGERVFGYRSRFNLTNAPVLETLEVLLDGMPTPAIAPSGRTVWTFDAASNSILFDTFSIPEPDVEVLVRYDSMCR